MCVEKGVRLVYLPPYLPDLNPIEEFFAEMKAFIRRKWPIYQDEPDHDFGAFLERCVDTVGIHVTPVPPIGVPGKSVRTVPPSRVQWYDS
jgi:hypothetical protein